MIYPIPRRFRRGIFYHFPRILTCTNIQRSDRMSIKQKKIVLAVALIFAVNLLIIAIAQSADAAVYRNGSSGATVKEIQTRLRSWGYYTGTVDGIYGNKTEAAVRYFQRTNGLTVDGMAGDKTLAAMGIYEKSSSVNFSMYVDVFFVCMSIHA